MNNKNPEYNGRFPGVDPILEPDHPDQAATDMLDEVVTGILENKDEEDLKKPSNASKNSTQTNQQQ